MDGLAPLLGRTLVLVAHPDDESAGCGALLQRMREPMVVFATDGAPRDPYFWKKYGSREAYAELRRKEAVQAMAAVGVRNYGFLSSATGAFVDQELFRRVGEAIDRLDAIVEEMRPEAMLSLAYEGGHPDHDTCNFIAAMIASERRLPVWEFPLYHRSIDGVGVPQQFPFASDGEVVLQVTAEERERKDEMLAAYPSQFTVLEQFDLDTERFRPMAAYDYSRPIHDGVLNYEAWEWKMTGKEVSAAFKDYLAQARRAQVQRKG